MAIAPFPFPLPLPTPEEASSKSSSRLELVPALPLPLPFPPETTLSLLSLIAPLGVEPEAWCPLFEARGIFGEGTLISSSSDSSRKLLLSLLPLWGLGFAGVVLAAGFKISAGGLLLKYLLVFLPPSSALFTLAFAACCKIIHQDVKWRDYPCSVIQTTLFHKANYHWDASNISNPKNLGRRFKHITAVAAGNGVVVPASFFWGCFINHFLKSPCVAILQTLRLKFTLPTENLAPHPWTREHFRNPQSHFFKRQPHPLHRRNARTTTHYHSTKLHKHVQQDPKTKTKEI